MPDQAPRIEASGGGRLVYDKTKRTIVSERKTVEARPLSEWHEDMGDVLWWAFPIQEPPYVGSPNDLGKTVEITVRAFNVDKMMSVMVGGWPGYHTHWTPMPEPPRDPR